MYITVRLLNGFQKPLLYKLVGGPDFQSAAAGSIVTVPLRNRYEPAIIINSQQTLTETVEFSIKEVTPDAIRHMDPRYFTFLSTLSTYYGTDVMHFAKRLQEFAVQKEEDCLESAPAPIFEHNAIMLTEEQATAYHACSNALKEGRFYPALIHGVTGSGKTEIYKKLLEDCRALHKSALFLVPEVTLALQFERILRAQLAPEIIILSYHSGTSKKDRKKVWDAINNKQPVIVLGVHLPVLLPIENLGLIIVDEEHETGYQEKKHPKINSKEAALMRAQQYKIPIILGSATPSISTLYQVHQKKYAFFQLKKRFAGDFPTLRIVTLDSSTKKTRPHFWISSELYYAIQDRLERKEQIIIFLNRRGHSFFVQCQDCSFIITCKQCSVSLTLHEHGLLLCHYCGYSCPEPTNCPQCMTSSSFIKKGVGTQQLVTILQQLFPAARIARADLDSSAKKQTWKQTVQDFENQQLDMLVGTQTITKGYHFPQVTLVGIIWADLSMHMPFFNAQETTLQQLIQVAGRAGRQTQHSLVVVQTMSHHQLFNYLDERTYLAFYEREIQERELLGYPPCKRLIAIELKHGQEKRVEQEAYAIAQQLRQYATINNLDMQILGPSKPMIHKIKKIHLRVIYLKSSELRDCIAAFNQARKRKYYSSIFFTPNPIN